MKDWQYIQRVKEILNECDAGRITDNQAIKKLMRSTTKHNQTELKTQREEVQDIK